MNRLPAYALLVLAVGGGSISLLGFAAFLFTGPVDLVRLGFTVPSALAWDAALSLVFFMQHSGMIRRAFRARLPSWLPPPCHAAFYSAASGLALLAVVLLWQPAPIVLLALPGPWRLVPRLIAAAGVAGFVWGVRALRQFDPFGQLALQAHLRGHPLAALPLAVRGPYRWVRHPLYSCMLVLIWSVPEITLDRLMFDVLWTAWIVAGARWEERDLVAEFGESYRRYQHAVPMLIPWRGPADVPPTSGSPSRPAPAPESPRPTGSP